MNNTTKLAGGHDCPVTENEHVLYDKDDILKAVRNMKYTVYTPQDVIDIIEDIMPYTTRERVEGLKKTAEIACADMRQASYDATALVRKVQAAERRARQAEADLAENQKKYSGLKERLGIVKAENRKLNELLDKAAEREYEEEYY